MKNIIILIISIFLLTSCFNKKEEEKQLDIIASPNNVESDKDQSKDVEIPLNEKSSQAEKDFSNDLQDLLKSIDETPNE